MSETVPVQVETARCGQARAPYSAMGKKNVTPEQLDKKLDDKLDNNMDEMMTKMTAMMTGLFQ
eukprot:8490317-Heterocapsa_arctica.AAC.1